MPKIYSDILINMATENPDLMIKSAEDKFNGEIRSVADKIISDKSIRIILLSGPSGSGKTTSANILKDMLNLSGKKTAVISLDNYFKNKNNYPLNHDGKPDFESINALEIDLLHDSLSAIAKGEGTFIPKFDFINQTRIDNFEKINIGENGVVIIEGIHALNPIISQNLPDDNILKIFVSVSTGIKDRNEREIISGIDIRCLRRVIRDSIYRGFSFDKTLNIWDSVLDGEQKWLYPFKSLADVKINTFHSFEVFVYSKYLCDKMSDENLPTDNRFYDILKQAAKMPQIDESLVPKNSLIREFIPGGIYENIY